MNKDGVLTSIAWCHASERSDDEPEQEDMAVVRRQTSARARWQNW